MEKHQLSDDISCCYDKGGCPIYHEGFNPHEYGVPISIGKTLELEIDENIKSVFAVTLDGILSNELVLDAPNTTYQILLTTVGGWKTPATLGLRSGLEFTNILTISQSSVRMNP